MSNTSNIYDLSKFATVGEALNNWYVKDLLPKSHNTSKYTTLGQLSEYLTKRQTAKELKEKTKREQRISTIQNAGALVSVKISVEWKKSRMWGSNPAAECWVTFKDANGDINTKYFSSGSISGCGYDKLSTAIADVLNQSNEVIKAFYTAMQGKNYIEQSSGYGNLSDIFGYGVSAFKGIPRIDGGVGVSCYNKVFDSIGYIFETVASGKTFDVFTIKLKD